MNTSNAQRQHNKVALQGGRFGFLPTLSALQRIVQKKEYWQIFTVLCFDNSIITCWQACIRAHHLDRLSSVDDGLSPDQAISGVHSNGAHSILSKMLCHFQHKPVRKILNLQGCHDGRQVPVKLHIDDGANDLIKP